MDGYSSRGLAELGKGQDERAAEDFEKMNEMQPNSQLSFFDRGCTHLLQAQTREAIADFQLSIAVDPKATNAVYATLWMHIAKKRLGDDDSDSMAKEAEKADLTLWPGPALKLYLDEITSDQVLSAAADPNPETQVSRMCEAHFYTAEYALMHQRRTAAEIEFRAARDACPKDYVEYAASLLELKKMSAAAAPRPVVHSEARKP